MIVFALGISDILGKLLRHYVITEVLFYKHLPVLVIDDFPWHTSEVVEGQMMGIDCCP